MDKKLTSEQKWEQAGLENGFIFYKVFRTHPEACKKLIEILLHIEIEKIEMAEEETIFIDREAKGIRLDLYVKNDTHVFDVELQVRNTKELAERARYYQGIMDVDSIKPKQHYHELKNSHVIFICIDDIFEQGLPIYTFENICVENSNVMLKICKQVPRMARRKLYGVLDSFGLHNFLHCKGIQYQKYRTYF